MLICLAFLTVILANARPITEKEAILAVRNYLEDNISPKRAEKKILKLTPIERNGILFGYAIDLDPDGFILVPAFTELSPIKAKFSNGRFEECKNHPLVELVTNEMAKVHSIVRQFHSSSKGYAELNTVFERQYAT